MTVQDVSSEVSFSGDGVVTSFVFNFRVDDLAWLSLSYLVSFNMIVLNGDQEISPGGTIEYFIAPPVDQVITLTRTTPLTQETDYTRHGPFDSEAHEFALDKLTMAIQDRDRNTALKSKSITVETPNASEDITIFYTTVGLTLTELVAVLTEFVPGSPSLDWSIRFGPDRNAAGTEVIIGGTTTIDVDTGDIITVMDNPSIPADSFVWLVTTAVTAGLIRTAHITLRYTEVLP